MSLFRLIPSISHDISRAFTMLEEPLLRRYPSAFPTVSDRLTFPNFFRPSVDVSETDKNYVIEAEVPGMKKEDLSIECLDDGTLVMKGKIEEGTAAKNMRTVDTTTSKESESSGAIGATVAEVEAAVTEPTLWTSERTRGHFQRSFQLPGKINPEEVKATYKDGILSIVVPKHERQRRQISIE